MSIQITVNLGNFSVTGDGEDVKEAIKGLSSSGALEVFVEQKCGKCGNTNIVPKCREVADPADKKGKTFFEYYELSCTNNKCWAKLALGQSKDGHGIFPKRKDDEGNWLPDRGWVLPPPKKDKPE